MRQTIKNILWNSFKNTTLFNSTRINSNLSPKILASSYEILQRRNFQTLIKASELSSLRVSHGFKNLVVSHRHIWGWLNSIFNRVDNSRIADAGADRACAEWLLRCGASVKWANSGSWTNDYNSLPVGGGRIFKIEEVDATDSAVMHIGFPHFKNCTYIRRMVFHKATYLDDESMAYLPLVKKSLKELQVSSCGNISRKGLENIKKLTNLEYLLLYDLPLIYNKEEVIKDFEEALPKCTIYFPYAQASERPQEEEST